VRGLRTAPRGLAVAVTLDVVLTILVRIAYGGGGALATICGIVLGPVAVVAVHRLGSSLGGPRFGEAAAVLVPVLPLLGVLYALPSYRTTYEHDALPALFGVAHPLLFAIGAAIAVVAAFAPVRAAAAAGAVALIVAVVVWGLGSLGGVRTSLHEAAWSVAFVEWLLVAGVLGAARRSPWLALALVGWLGLFLLRAAHRTFDHAHFWIALAPAVPAAAILSGAIALLAPPLRRAAR
jgi:hypothetical protein